MAKKDFGSVPPSFLVIHHTWKPRKDEWNGATSIAGLKKYYEGLGWSAGPHLFVAEDGIWLFTDMYEVGIHAGAGNGSLATGYSVGIEVVGDYDNEVWSGQTLKNAVGAISALLGRLSIPQSKIMFHRDYSSKTCPGKSITKKWLLNQLNSKEMPNEYEKNLYAIYRAVEDLLGRKDGDNPNDDETDDIVKDLSKLAKEIDELRKRPVEKIVEKVVEKPVEKIVYRDKIVEVPAKCETAENETSKPEVGKTFLEWIFDFLTKKK